METERDRLAEALATLEAQGDDPDAADAEEVVDVEAEAQRLSSALDDLDDRIDAAHAALLAWTPEQMARTGALLRIDHCGEVVASRGLTRPEDRHAGSEAGDPQGYVDRNEAGAGTARTRAAFSEKLMRDLTAHRTSFEAGAKRGARGPPHGVRPRIRVRQNRKCLPLRRKKSGISRKFRTCMQLNSISICPKTTTSFGQNIAFSPKNSYKYRTICPT